ncbi:MAG TPA: UpxY family transcription antiterminator [Puia sp.]|jgi:transcription antitermination factor NusG
MSEIKQGWFAIYTKPRWEKKVYALLKQGGIEAYCPLNKVRKQWSDRVKWVEEPLFKSYIFVRVARGEHTNIRMVNGVVNFVYWLGQPAVIRDEEIKLIRKFLDEYREVQAVQHDLSVNARIKIRNGAFMDKEAVVVKILNNKVQVVIESIGYSLMAVISKSNIAVHDEC